MVKNEQPRALIRKILADEPVTKLARKIRALHPAQLGNLIEALPPEKRVEVWRLLNAQIKGETLLEVRGEVRQQLIKASKTSELVAAVSRLQVDEIADLDQRLPNEVVKAVLVAMDSQKRERYEAIKDYPDDTAGGLMDVDAIAIRSDITVYVALRYLRAFRRKYNKLPEHLSEVFVVDSHNKFVGTVELKDLISLPNRTPIANLINTNREAVLDTLPEKKVARLFEDQDLISAPVVNEDNVLLGRITIDDVVDVIRQEGEQMLMRPAGLSEKTDIFSPVFRSVKFRSLWLGINLINAFIAASIVNLFTDSIEKIVALAVLMPVVASMGGVVGNQTLTLVTRGIALEQITKENSTKLLLKEVMVGFVNGMIWAVIVGGFVFIWLHDIMLSLVFSTALLLSLMLSATAGTLIPLILHKLKIDPALAGTVVLVAISDVAGFFIFLGIASLVLLH